jgi:hypothetical protein
LLNVHGVHDARQIDVHTAEPLIPEPSLVEVEIAIGKLKSYKSPGTDQIPAELIKAGGEILFSLLHRLICCIWNKKELPQQWNHSFDCIIRRILFQHSGFLFSCTSSKVFLANLL